MPILKAHIPTGHTQEQKTAALTAYTRATCEALGAALPSVRVMLLEVPAEHSVVGGQVGAPMVVIEAVLIEGRDETLKAGFISALTNASAEALGVDGEGVRVVIHDVAKTNIGMGGQSAKALGR